MPGRERNAMTSPPVELEAFAAEHGPALKRLAFLLTGGSTEDAEDIVQTVLVRLLERGLGHLDNPAAYARRAVVNEHVTLLRRRATALQWITRNPPADLTIDPELDERFVVLAALRSLGVRERAAIVLRYYADRPDEEIAEILRCSRPTVRSLVHRALPKLRRYLLENASPGEWPARSVPATPQSTSIQEGP
jgi:RNA polymerase sigma-70 factor (sigma-E family)